jgi:hypothetical protein
MNVCLLIAANYKNKTAMIRIATGRNPIQITMSANMTSFWSSSAKEGKRRKALFPSCGGQNVLVGVFFA